MGHTVVGFLSFTPLLNYFLRVYRLPRTPAKLIAVDSGAMIGVGQSPRQASTVEYQSDRAVGPGPRVRVGLPLFGNR